MSYILVAGGWCWWWWRWEWSRQWGAGGRHPRCGWITWYLPQEQLLLWWELIHFSFWSWWVQCVLQSVSPPTNTHTNTHTHTRIMSLPHSCNEAIEKYTCLKEKTGCAQATSLELTAMLVVVSSLSTVNIHTLKNKYVCVYIGGRG